MRPHPRPALHLPPIFLIAAVVSLFAPMARAQVADLILHNGKVITVDAEFSVAQAVAVKDGRILRVGSNDDVLATRGNTTQVVDLGGKVLMPGLMDSHTHPVGAAMHEFDHEIPDMRSIADVLEYVKQRAKVLDEGEWVFISQVFITRLDERRYPTRAELDAAAPNHPVMFRTGPDASLNSLALKRSGIDKDFQGDGGAGEVERDPQTGEPTGILRGCTRYAKYEEPKSGKTASEQDRYHRLLTLFKDYNSVGLTAIADRAADASSVRLYHRMLDNNELPVRISASRNLGAGGNAEAMVHHIGQIADEPQVGGLPSGHPGAHMLRIVGVKLFLDGGMLTGSARMRRPWGLSKIYSIEDPDYKGVFRTPAELLQPLVAAAVEHKLQFTAHSVGDGAVHALLDAYEAVSETTPIRETRPCITHSNFMSLEAVQQMKRLGVVADIQPAWLWLDTRTLSKQFDNDRLRYFQPLATIFEHGVIAGGGSDHMQKIGSLRAVNPYNPWLGMWVTITRNARDYDGALHSEEALTREQAIRFYTSNNSYILFLDQAGSLEVDKLADMIVIDRDVLTCPVVDIVQTQVLRTYMGGKLVYEKE